MFSTAVKIIGFIALLIALTLFVDRLYAKRRKW